MLDIYEDKTWNLESITKTNSLYNSMISTQFIMSLIVCNNSLNFIDNLITALQSRAIDAYKANQDIHSVKRHTFVEIQFMKYNSNGMKKHHICYHIQIK